jgi:hypothetical protein
MAVVKAAAPVTAKRRLGAPLLAARSSACFRDLEFPGLLTAGWAGLR